MKSSYQTKLLIEQHFHGAFGVDFNKASVDDVLYLSKEILKYGIGGIFPTVVTDSIENTRRAVSVIKEASQKQTSDMAKILGIHLEGIFINPEKKGIHNPKHFLSPTVENYKLVEDNFIKIVTLAPELDNGLIKYLKDKNVKVQAGHCTGGDLTGCSGVTHLFNAMSGITHRGKSAALSALINDDIYTEIIADGVHVSDDALKLLFKTKPIDKIILVSDCLPCTKLEDKRVRGLEDKLFNDISHSEVLQEQQSDNDHTSIPPYLYTSVFADETIYYDGVKATSKEGTLAGSTTLLPEIITRLAGKIEDRKAGGMNVRQLTGEQGSGSQEVKPFNNSNIDENLKEQQNDNNLPFRSFASRPFDTDHTSIKQLINNPYKYHNIDLNGSIEWDGDWNIVSVNNQ